MLTATVAARSAAVALARPAAREKTDVRLGGPHGRRRRDGIGEVDLLAGQPDDVPAVGAQARDQVPADEPAGTGDQGPHAGSATASTSAGTAVARR